MDAHPTIVLNDALAASKGHLESAGSTMASVLVEQLAEDRHFAEFEITVRGRIVDPHTGVDVGIVEHRMPYNVYWDRDPVKRDQSE